MSKKTVKTNAMRILDTEKIDHKELSYPVSKDHVDGVSAAQALGKDPRTVYKTLVTQAGSRSYYVFVIPVAENLNLKKAARACGEKNIEMIHVKDINKVTGYIRGWLFTHWHEKILSDIYRPVSPGYRNYHS